MTYKDYKHMGTFLLTGIKLIILFCVPSSFRSIYYGGCVQEGSWSLHTHTSLYGFLGPCMLVTRQKARSFVAGQLWGVAESSDWEGGLLPLCCSSVTALLVSQGAHHMSKQWSFRPGSRMESIRPTDINTVGFLHGAEATRRPFTFWTLTWLCMLVTHSPVQASNAIEGFTLNLWANSDYLVRWLQDNARQKALKLSF